MTTDTAESPAKQAVPTLRIGRLTIVAAVLVLIAAGVGWYYQLFPGTQTRARANAILVIAPYREHGTWVFDDASVGLKKEPFVAGVPEMIDVLVKDIPQADRGFRLLFSARPFPGYQKDLKWQRGDQGGNYYAMDNPSMEGWICPAMFKYYDQAPEHLYVKAEPIRR